jgi:hypothetical protein
VNKNTADAFGSLECLAQNRQLVSDWFAGQKTPTWDSGLKIQAFLKKQRGSRS